MKLKNKLPPLLESIYQREQAFIEGLPDDERAAIGTAEAWAAKDVIAHIAFWKGHMAENLAAVSQGKEPTGTNDFEQVNQEVFEQHRHDSWEDVRVFAERAHHALLESIDALGDDDLESTDFFPWQQDAPVWRSVVGNGYTHPIFHLVDHHLKHGRKELATELAEELAEALLQFDDSPDWQGNTRYNLACHYALAGQKAKAIQELGPALELNPGLVEWSKQDSDLDSLRDDPAYQALYEG